MLKKQIIDEMKKAMKAQDKMRLLALRYIVSEIKNAEIDARVELDDEAVVAVLLREVKKRREGIDLFEKAGREVTEEKEKLAVIEEFLPEMMSQEEVAKIVDEVVSSFAKAAEEVNFGAVMGRVMGKCKGKADGKMVQELVRERL